MTAWRQSTKFHAHREAREYGRELEAWLDQVARELGPRDPPAAVALFEMFIEADTTWFERRTTPTEASATVVRAACRHWLQAAARCEAPPTEWPTRLVKLVEEDEYGAREEWLRRADLLLGEPALRTLAAVFEEQMADALSNAPDAQQLPHRVFKISASLSLLHPKRSTTPTSRFGRS